MSDVKDFELFYPFADEIFPLFTKHFEGFEGNGTNLLDPSKLSAILHERFTVYDPAYDSNEFFEKVIDYFKNVVIPHKIAVYDSAIKLLNNKALVERVFIDPPEIDQFHRNLVMHDLSKFSSSEAVGYACYDRKSGEGKQAFETAWHHHKMNNPHHPEYWLNPNRSGELEPIDMPPIYILEMITDWMGAGKTYGTTMQQWLPENLPKFKFNNYVTVARIIELATGIKTKVEHGRLMVMKAE